MNFYLFYSEKGEIMRHLLFRNLLAFFVLIFPFSASFSAGTDDDLESNNQLNDVSIEQNNNDLNNYQIIQDNAEQKEPAEEGRNTRQDRQDSEQEENQQSYPKSNQMSLSSTYPSEKNSLSKVPDGLGKCITPPDDPKRFKTFLKCFGDEAEKIAEQFGSSATIDASPRDSKNDHLDDSTYTAALKRLFLSSCTVRNGFRSAQADCGNPKIAKIAQALCTYSGGIFDTLKSHKYEPWKKFKWLLYKTLKRDTTVLDTFKKSKCYKKITKDTNTDGNLNTEASEVIPELDNATINDFYKKSQKLFSLQPFNMKFSSDNTQFFDLDQLDNEQENLLANPSTKTESNQPTTQKPKRSLDDVDLLTMQSPKKSFSKTTSLEEGSQTNLLQTPSQKPYIEAFEKVKEAAKHSKEDPLSKHFFIRSITNYFNEIIQISSKLSSSDVEKEFYQNVYNHLNTIIKELDNTIATKHCKDNESEQDPLSKKFDCTIHKLKELFENNEIFKKSIAAVTLPNAAGNDSSSRKNTPGFHEKITSPLKSIISKIKEKEVAEINAEEQNSREEALEKDLNKHSINKDALITFQESPTASPENFEKLLKDSIKDITESINQKNLRLTRKNITFYFEEFSKIAETLTKEGLIKQIKELKDNPNLFPKIYAFYQHVLLDSLLDVIQIVTGVTIPNTKTLSLKEKIDLIPNKKKDYKKLSDFNKELISDKDLDFYGKLMEAKSQIVNAKSMLKEFDDLLVINKEIINDDVTYQREDLENRLKARRAKNLAKNLAKQEAEIQKQKLQTATEQNEIKNQEQSDLKKLDQTIFNNKLDQTILNNSLENNENNENFEQQIEQNEEIQYNNEKDLYSSSNIENANNDSALNDSQLNVNKDSNIQKYTNEFNFDYNDLVQNQSSKNNDLIQNIDEQNIIEIKDDPIILPLLQTDEEKKNGE